MSGPAQEESTGEAPAAPPVVEAPAAPPVVEAPEAPEARESAQSALEAPGAAPVEPTTLVPARPGSGAGAEDSTPGAPGGASRSPEVWRLVAVAGVSLELPDAFPEVILHEAQDPWRELRIPVGMAEGSAIAYAFRSIITPRPLTHGLVTEILQSHEITIEAVRITARRGQLFHAELDTVGPRGRRVLPSRPSDAIALALRQRLPTPILVADWVFASVAPGGDDESPEAVP